MSKYSSAAGRRPYEIPLLVVAVAAAGFNLRTAITSLPPLFPDLQGPLHLSPATLSLLAATPVICFGVVSAFAARLNRRYGEEVILLAALVLIAAGLLLRGAAASSSPPRPAVRRRSSRGAPAPTTSPGTTISAASSTM